MPLVNLQPYSQTVPGGLHKYWRLYQPFSAQPYASAGEIQLKSVAGGANLCVGGSFATSSSAPDKPGPQAFDGIFAGFNGWISLNRSMDEWIKYTFVDPINVVELVFQYYYYSTIVIYWRPELRLEWSDDDVNWTTAATWTNLSQTKGQVFTLPVVYA